MVHTRQPLGYGYVASCVASCVLVIIDVVLVSDWYLLFFSGLVLLAFEVRLRVVKRDYLLLLRGLCYRDVRGYYNVVQLDKKSDALLFINSIQHRG